SDDDEREQQQSGNITITVGDSKGCVTRRPDYSWEGDGVSSLIVTDSTGSVLLWKLLDKGNNDGISSPVTQGTVQTGIELTNETGDVDGKLPKEKWSKITVERKNGDKGEAWFVAVGGCN
ncbi:MAG: hypothetical protein HQK83_01260, partial [Fibrobacteria bacterium]|nr:hypothetical protein [Fibrobacteria bacterium]